MNGENEERTDRSSASPPSGGGLADRQRLNLTFVELADTLTEEFDVVEFLYLLVNRCVELLDVSAVGLMLGDDRGRLRVMAASSEETRMLELFQLQNEQGPCLECFRSGAPVEEPDLRAAQARWPLFAPEATRAGFGAVQALPMRLRASTVGALNLFHVEPHALDEADVQAAQALVDVATIGLIQVRLGRRDQILTEQLQRALDTRVVIEQAKGILAQRLELTPGQAFGVLRDHARGSGIKLSDLAYAVTENSHLAAGIRAAPTSLR